MATGETFESLGTQFRVSSNWIGAIVRKVLRSIVENLFGREIPTPTCESFKKNAFEFETQWNYPNCVGAIDGKHIRIRCPDRSGSMYINYKMFHSIVLLAIVDANYKFTAIDVGSYGREGDAGIFLKSNMGKRIIDKSFGIPTPQVLPGTNIELPCVILGDEAFGLRENLMKPFPRIQSLYDKSKAIYNYRHSRGRRTTENTFGILSQTFRIFHTAIIAQPVLIDDIVVASCILHNLIRNSRDTKMCSTDHFPVPTENIISITASGGRSNEVAIQVRDTYKNYFIGSGSVSWQDRMVGIDY